MTLQTALNPFSVSGKNILVTGASSGIGRATAIAASQLGATLHLVGRREAQLEETRQLLDAPANHTVWPFDLRETDAIPPWVAGIASSTGRPFDGLVHAAGVSGIVPLRVINRAQLDAIMTLDLYAALALLRGVSAKNACGESLSVVLVSSVAGLTGTAGLTAYSAAKGALIALARSAAQELARKNVRVNCVAPGYVRTPMFDEASSVLPEDQMTPLKQRHLLGLLEPDEVAHAITYLLSDAARRITGSTFTIDSGYTT